MEDMETSFSGFYWTAASGSRSKPYPKKSVSMSSIAEPLFLHLLHVLLFCHLDTTAPHGLPPVLMRLLTLPVATSTIDTSADGPLAV